MPSLAVLLTILFVVLKLTGVILWSWLWVLSPLWIAFVLSIVAVLVVKSKIKKVKRSFKRLV
jgi:hypothetical protein